MTAKRQGPSHQRCSQGFCVWFTGLSGSGKSTTADMVANLLSRRGRKVTILDGDIVRTRLSPELGFSKEDRNLNIRRIGFAASEIVREGGAVICAVISPYRAAREECRSMIGADHFLEVFVDTPLAVCEERDPKGLYARARRGDLKNLTGIDDPYEAPVNPDLRLNTVNNTAEENAHAILSCLVNTGFVDEDSVHPHTASSRF